MKLVFSEQAWADYLYWQACEANTLDRVNVLIKERLRAPFKGMGKPEPLKGDLKGFWSRRITLTDRLVYRVSGADDAQQLDIAQCRFHC